MGLTPKQERNGIPEMEAGVNSAVAGEADMPAIPMGEATAAGIAFKEKGLGIFLGEGLPSQAQTEWDAGLAVNDVEGGGSS